MAVNVPKALTCRLRFSRKANRMRYDSLIENAQHAGGVFARADIVWAATDEGFECSRSDQTSTK